MTGAMNVTVTESDSVRFWADYFSCTGKIGSSPWSFSASPEEPGYWELDGADGGTIVEFEAPGSAPCVFTYSIPPPTSPCLSGVPVAGTFSCGQLVDEDDPTQVISVAEGRFATLVSGGECD
jgi:hypothetical protein